ncbi:MAG: PorT family protein [Rikenellaceae bacterium]|nr:PorT family protein [Rikenellaceae bacterium]MCL2692448.1 PorT family protein [Rikenellaceae bacterium]
MKKLLLAAAAIMVIAVGTTGTATAFHPLDFGIKGGINTGKFDLKRSNIPENLHIVNDARTGYHAGAYMRLSLLGLHVQPELLYNWNSYDMKVLSGNGALTTDRTRVRVNTLELPVVAGIEFLFLRLGVGPVFNLSNEVSLGHGTVSKVEMDRPAVSFTAGIGLNLMRLSIDARYNTHFKKTDNQVVVGGQTLNIGNNFQGWTFSLGYRLFPGR